jgi:hypothetical protein
MTPVPDDDWLLSIRPQREQITAEDSERPVPITIDWAELGY